MIPLLFVGLLAGQVHNPPVLRTFQAILACERRNHLPLRFRDLVPLVKILSAPTSWAYLISRAAAHLHKCCFSGGTDRDALKQRYPCSLHLPRLLWRRAEPIKAFPVATAARPSNLPQHWHSSCRSVACFDRRSKTSQQLKAPDTLCRRCPAPLVSEIGAEDCTTTGCPIRCRLEWTTASFNGTSPILTSEHFNSLPHPGFARRISVLG